MSGTWSWELLDAQRRAVSGAPNGGSFPSQSEAESWLGEEWRTLLDAGVEISHY